MDSGTCQAGQSKQESRYKSVPHASWGNSSDCQYPALNPLPVFCVVDLESQVGAEVDVGSEGVHNEHFSAVSVDAAENQRPVLTHLNQLLLSFLL